MSGVTIIAYSSSANLGPGYDVLALAHTSFYDRITLNINRNDTGRRVEIEADNVPLDPLKNTAGLSVLRLLEDFDINEKVSLKVEKGIPHGLGLGSSGASSAAAVVAADMLFGLNLSTDEKVHYATLGEIAASGTPHSDNVSASICGGLIFVKTVNPVSVGRIDIDEKFGIMLAVPDVVLEGKTRMAREMVPKNVTTREMVENTRRLSSLITGFTTGDSELIREGMNDNIVETSRSSLFPFYHEIRRMAFLNDAAGVSVSGAGPSILIITDDQTDRSAIDSGARKIFSSYGLKSNVIISSVSGGAINEDVNTFY